MFTLLQSVNNSFESILPLSVNFRFTYFSTCLTLSSLNLACSGLSVTNISLFKQVTAILLIGIGKEIVARPLQEPSWHMQFLSSTAMISSDVLFNQAAIKPSKIPQMKSVNDVILIGSL